MSKNTSPKVEFPNAQVYGSGLCFVYTTINGSTTTAIFNSNDKGSAHSKAWAFSQEEASRLAQSTITGWEVTMWDTRPVPKQ